MPLTTIPRSSTTETLPGKYQVLASVWNLPPKDSCRPDDERDWGISQLDAVMDRTEIRGNHFLVLTNFGDHALHHLFPTLDHGTLEQLYPVFEETMKQFNVDLRVRSQFEMIAGQFMQLSREKPNPNPPDLLKKKAHL